MPDERDSQPSSFEDNPIDDAISAQNTPVDDEQAVNSVGQEPPIEGDMANEAGAQLALQDVHSQAIGPIDTHSVRSEVAATAATQPSAPPVAESVATPPKAPVVKATVQATHAAVNATVQ